MYVLFFNLLGEDYQELYGLNKENIYDPSVNPSMSQELSSAAIRVLHTLIPVQFKYVSISGSQRRRLCFLGTVEENFGAVNLIWAIWGGR